MAETKRATTAGATNEDWIRHYDAMAQALDLTADADLARAVAYEALREKGESYVVLAATERARAESYRQMAADYRRMATEARARIQREAA